MTDSTSAKIRAKERDPLLQSLRAGVVPARGQHLIQVGRKRELEALIADVDRVAEGGSGFRLVVGPYGAGKTFFLNLVRTVAMERKLVTVHADLSPEHRLHASGGEARALYGQLVVRMATRAKPDGGALENVVEKFVSSARDDAAARGVSGDVAIRERLRSLEELPGGFDFAQVVAQYWRGKETGDDVLCSNAVRWLRGEFTTKTDARNALGVRTFVGDAEFYAQLKLLARFTRLAGYGGLLVVLDEMVNLFKLGSGAARKSNYEAILGMLNDCLQGNVEGLAFVLGGTPDFVMDPKKGLYSYGALATRLAENRFAKDGLVDFSGPVVNLAALTPEEVVVLLHNLRHVYASGDPVKYLVPDEAIRAFLDHCAQQIGDAYFRTPRDTTKAFVGLLDVLEQNPGVSWREHLGRVHVDAPPNPDPTAPTDAEEAPKTTSGDDELTSLRL
jgi:hypothetical protein